MTQEFQEIAHSGGQAYFNIETSSAGQRVYSAGYQSSRPVPSVLIGVYALPQGIPVGSLSLGGIGVPMGEPPIPGCFPVLIASDSEGKFGHSCPNCQGYWRSGPWPRVCPYCGLHVESHDFLSDAQHLYVKHYCDTLAKALATPEDGKIVIDMDVVADAVGDAEKPEFYVAEKSQQHKFRCTACNEFNDILGRFGYCSLCGTRNDLTELQTFLFPEISKSLLSGEAPERCLREAVSVLDTFISQYAKQLAALVPLTKKRQKRLTAQRFHDLVDVYDKFNAWFDIDIFYRISDEEQAFINKLLLRRHLYEHNGGEVDQKYLDKSGDTSVVLKQQIRERKEDVEHLLRLLLDVGRNVHNGFHALFPPEQGPIEAFSVQETS